MKMSDQKYKDEIEKLTKQVAHMMNERNLHQTVNLSLECKVKDLQKEIRMQKTTISNYDQHVQVNAGKMLQMSERICELEITGATQPASGPTEREKELEAELKISQLVRNELRMEFEKIHHLHEESQIRSFFFQIMFEFDTAEIKSLTKDQFDKKIKRFFKMLSDLYPLDNPLDNQKHLDEGKRTWKLSMIYVHPDKNSNDPCAGAKFQVFNEAYYENFTK
jgi:hypothetical protein